MTQKSRGRPPDIGRPPSTRQEMPGGLLLYAVQPGRIVPEDLAHLVLGDHLGLHLEELVEHVGEVRVLGMGKSVAVTTLSSRPNWTQ